MSSRSGEQVRCGFSESRFTLGLPWSPWLVRSTESTLTVGDVAAGGGKVMAHGSWSWNESANLNVNVTSWSAGIVLAGFVLMVLGGWLRRRGRVLLGAMGGRNGIRNIG